MQPFALALLETFAERRGALTDALSHLIHSNPHQEAGVFYRSDMEQMLDAVVVLLKEALLGTDAAVRERFLQQILPDMLIGSGPADGLLHLVVAWNAMLATEIDRHIGPAHRDAARLWLADFSGGWIAAMARIAAAVEVRT